MLKEELKEWAREEGELRQEKLLRYIVDDVREDDTVEGNWYIPKSKKGSCVVKC